MALFSRLEAIDWASLQHAYGPADDVPELVRGLVSDSAEAREAALDGMYGAVSHQGDVYDSTVAVIPFLLEALGDAALPGRAEVLGLIGHIGASAMAIVERGGAAPLAQRAVEALRQAKPQLLAAIMDGDVAIRREAPGVVAACTDVVSVEAALRAQLGREADAEARRRQVGALAGVLARDAGRARELEEWLSGLVAGDADPAVRVDAVALLLERTSAPSEALVEQAGRALVTLYQRKASSSATPSAGTDTLTGALRAMEEQERAGREAPDAGHAVHRVSDALGDRVEARVRVLVGLLGADDWEMQLDALGPLSKLMGNWRGDYREVARLLGERLVRGHARVRPRAAKLLEDLFQLAAPAREALAEAVRSGAREAPLEDEGLPPWVIRWEGDGQRTCGPTVVALARVGDARALPAFEWMLEQEDLPRDVGFALAPLGAAAAPLAGRVAERLSALVELDPTGRAPAVAGLVYAAAELGPAGHAAVTALLRLAPQDELAIRALGKVGPGAAAAVPLLRALAEQSDPRTAVAAATALAAIAPEAVPLAPVFARHLAQWGAGAGLSRLGAAAAPYVKNVRVLFEDWSVEAAGALWRMTGELELEPFELAWEQGPHQREEIATLLAEIGPPAAAMAGAVETELRRVRRHNANEHGWSSHQVEEDERLLTACRRALDRLRS